MQFPLKITDFNAAPLRRGRTRVGAGASVTPLRRGRTSVVRFLTLGSGPTRGSRAASTIRRDERAWRGGGIVGGACFVAVSYVPFGPALAAFLRMLCRLSPCIRKARAAGGTQMRAVGRSICEAVCER